MANSFRNFGKSLTCLAPLGALAAWMQLAGCAAPADEDGASAPCEIDPELVARGSVAPQRLSANGQNLNGIQTNGIQANGIQSNAGYMNGVQLNGVSLNAGYINGVSLGGGGVLAGVAGNELTGAGADGRAISGEAFVGAKIPALLSDGRTIELVVASFERSGLDADVALYGLEYEGQSLCADGAKGMFLPGTWDERGARHDQVTIGAATATATFACPKGVIAKCVTWGYAPWRVGAALHQTCTRMARADYCGTGVSYTKDGTRIDVVDVAGIQSPANEPDLAFEAGWNEQGATCVSRTRYAAHAPDGTEILPSCWQSLPRCSSLEEAKALGATIMNASRPQSRTICR